MVAMRDDLAGDYNIDTPESVAFDYEIADIGSRFIAALIDTTILGLALAGLNTVLGLVLRLIVGETLPEIRDLFSGELGWGGGLAVAVFAVLNSFLFWGYYLLFELRWGGQTPGKRFAKIRVVRSDGAPAGASEIVVRNLVRIVDLLPMAYLAGFVCMIANRQARRLGDFAAGTLAVKAVDAVTLESLLIPLVQPVPEVGPAAPVLDVRGLSAADFSLVRDLLARDAMHPLDDALVARLAAAIAAKIGHKESLATDPRRFLRQVAGTDYEPVHRGPTRK